MKIRLKNEQEFMKMVLVQGYSYRQFGRAIGVSGSYISRIIRGKQAPSPCLARRITDLLKVDFENIFLIIEN